MSVTGVIVSLKYKKVMIMLYAILFFSLGAIVSWLCFCWNIDRWERSDYNKIMALNEEIDSALNSNLEDAIENDILYKIIAKDIVGAIFHMSGNPKIAIKIEKKFKQNDIKW